MDLDLIPSYYSHFDSPEWKTVRGHSYQDANYQLIADNLLDLSHDQFLHANYHRKDTFLTTPHEVFEEGKQVVSSRKVLNQVTSDAFAGNLPDPSVPVDQWKVMKWQAPGYFLLEVGVRHRTGQAQRAHPDAGYRNFDQLLLRQCAQLSARR